MTDQIRSLFCDSQQGGGVKYFSNWVRFDQCQQVESGGNLSMHEEEKEKN